MASSSSPKPTDSAKAQRASQLLPKLDPGMPEPGTPEFEEEARRQSLLIANSPHEAEDIAWVESVASLCWDDE